MRARIPRRPAESCMLCAAETIVVLIQARLSMFQRASGN
jgi:hypothetical protein